MKKCSFMEIKSKGCIEIIRKLYRGKCIGEKHLPEVLCLRWIRHLPKHEHKEAMKEWHKCLSEGLVLTKQKPTEKHVYLNPERLGEIEEIMGES